MEEVWRQGEPTTVKLVMDALNRKAKPPRAYTTYMTVMRRLNDKGLLSRRRSGRSDTYEATLTREQYQERRAGAEVRDLVDQFGDVALAHFARSLSALDPAQRAPAAPAGRGRVSPTRTDRTVRGRRASWE